MSWCYTCGRTERHRLGPECRPGIIARLVGLEKQIGWCLKALSKIEEMKETHHESR